MTKAKVKKAAMSEPTTLTERERAVFAQIARTLGRGATGGDVIVSNALSHFLDADFRARSAESASPPRVPESGPGQPTDIVERLIAEANEWDQEANMADEEGDHPMVGKERRNTAAIEREAAAVIARLREQVKTERRAGIEAAAAEAQKVVVACMDMDGEREPQPSPSEVAQRIEHSIRALAAARTGE